LADIAQLGVVHTLVCQLARLFDCPPELAAVAEERNRRTARGMSPYAQLLYQDAGIVATVVDSDLAPEAPGLTLIPGRVMRLFQMGPAIDQLLAEAGSYGELLRAYEARLERAVRVGGCVGVKSHLAEVAGFGATLATPAEAERALGAAKAGDAEAYKRLYTAVFAATLRVCQALNVPVHLHSGITGGVWDGPIGNADPFLLAPLLRDPAYRSSRIVLLHAGYPWIEQASLMAHAFPQVWVDISWVTPWTSLRAVECMRAFFAAAPLSRLMIGSGGHGTPEVAWLAAIVAKIALSTVLDEAVALGLMAAKTAESTAGMVLHDNAARLYGLGL
jgi:predicted TIM-barrel fold metal-dependent hydrolase